MMTMMPTSGQPMFMSIGPPLNIAVPYAVRQPDRIEMIVNDTAKLEKPPIRRSSSWAYPSLWRVSVSLSIA